MKKIIAAFAVLALLAGCAGTPLVQTTTNREKFFVYVHVVSEERVGSICAGMGAWQPAETIGACSRFDESANTLELWVVAPTSLDDYLHFKRIGHEVWHGVKGDFHVR